MRLMLLTTTVVALLASACGQNIPPAAASATPAASPAVADDPPLENGFYVATGSCPFEGCSLRKWVANKVVELRKSPNLTAPVVGKVANEEWVKAVDAVSYIVPLHGVVKKDMDQLKAGDVIWRLNSLGEGSFDVWRKGEIVGWTDDGSRDDADPKTYGGVTWDLSAEDAFAKQKADEAKGAGWWVKLFRANGETGWTQITDYFPCSDILAGDPECEAAQKK